ncbi:hypothetical protein HYALB_00007997 [Hymenoscyphus albidus]|uniref:Uncharacterized protein n=1 Tax=Hymenoscyphus albidus TaxID=595503 RepID=A0A9N9LFW5_9HELO|nr:hypothetical protein HYALB_00007997 [Hymenoscyphus albidus]
MQEDEQAGSENASKYQIGDEVLLNLGKPRGSFKVEIVGVRKHEESRLYQYQVKQGEEPYNNGEWVEQKRLKWPH